VVHAFSSAIGVVNIAYLMGFREIVLVGVDLREKGYFWLAPGEVRPYEKPGLTASSPFTDADDIVATLGRWRGILSREGVSLSVYSAASRLSEVMPVYSPSWRGVGSPA
jgi:hypothetical protein